MLNAAVWFSLLGAIPAVHTPTPVLQPSFEGLEWSSGRTEVKRQLQRRNFIFHKNVSDAKTQDSIFFGKVMNKPVTVQNWFNERDQLVKTTVVFSKNKATNLFFLWKLIRRTLEAQYGVGQLIYSVPVTTKPDNSSLTRTLNSGKEMSEIWLFPSQDDTIWLSIGRAYASKNDYYLILTYQSPQWPSELKRRNRYVHP